MQGIVIRSTGSWYQILSDDGEKIECRIKGKLRLDDIETSSPITIGDRVDFIIEPKQQTGIISEILPRKNHIIRKTAYKGSHIVAANIDQLVLIVCIRQPKVKLGFIDRVLISAEQYEIPVFLIFNKSDLYNSDDLDTVKEINEIYNKVGYSSYLISAFKDDNLESIKTLISEKLTLVMGQSGVGKSTLINKLIPGLDLKVGHVSESTKKGRHTTSYAEMYEFSTNSWIIDTPGLKEFALINTGPEHISYFLPEMRRILINCKYNNCLHIEEPDCAVKEALENDQIAKSRYESYKKLINEMSV